MPQTATARPGNPEGYAMAALPEQPGTVFIGGTWTGADRERRSVINPATGTEIAIVAEASADDVARAVGAARRASDDAPWRALPARERGRVLLRAAGMLREQGEDFARRESLDTGKPLTLSRIIDTATAADMLEYHGSLAGSIEGAVRYIPFALPGVLGHEGASAVEAVGSSVTRVAPGARSRSPSPLAAGAVSAALATPPTAAAGCQPTCSMAGSGPTGPPPSPAAAPRLAAHPSVPWQDEAIAVAGHKPQVYIDLSGWSPKHFSPQLVARANSLLKRKVLFGSDFPALTPDRWLADFAKQQLRDEVRPLILKDNAARLLGLVNTGPAGG
jgi:hypothetical protein